MSSQKYGIDQLQAGIALAGRLGDAEKGLDVTEGLQPSDGSVFIVRATVEPPLLRLEKTTPGPGNRDRVDQTLLTASTHIGIIGSRATWEVVRDLPEAISPQAQAVNMDPEACAAAGWFIHAALESYPAGDGN